MPLKSLYELRKDIESDIRKGTSMPRSKEEYIKACLNWYDFGIENMSARDRILVDAIEFVTNSNELMDSTYDHIKKALEQFEESIK